MTDAIDTCTECGCDRWDHADPEYGGWCDACGEVCPGWVGIEDRPEVYDPAEDHDPIPGLTIRVHGSVS